MNNDYLLEVKNIGKTFKSKGRIIEAVGDVSFSLKKGETLSIVGESGCGKSTTGRMILRLIEADKGEIWFKGKNLRTLNKKALRKIRPSMQIVFQDPYGSLNPRMTVWKLLAEPIKIDKTLSKEAIEAECKRLLKSVEMEVEDLDKYPHEFSGGQRQRIGIARAIATKPDLVICDEPVSALDLLVQAQMLNLLKNVQKKFQFSYIFISHDLSVVKHMSDRVAIMYRGDIVEIGTTIEIFETPRHPYTKLLLKSVLGINPNIIMDVNDDYTNESFRNDNNSCKFSNCCSHMEELCILSKISLDKVSDTHYVACRKIDT